MDEDVNEDIEEGEIIDNYTPLERPSNCSTAQQNNRFPNKLLSDSDSELQTTSDSSSDSDELVYRQKRPKLKAKPCKPLYPTRKPNKYNNIWSTHIQEDVLADTLNTCDVTLKDRSRSVETYDYTLSNSCRLNNKRSRSDRSNSNLRLVKQEMDTKDDLKGSSRNILDLVVTSENSIEEIAKDISNKLYENKEELLCKIISVAGKEKAIQVFNEVKRIEKEGGMLIMNQSRRRTPGGIYFFLIKHDNELTQKQQNNIFDDEKQKYKTEVKTKKKKKMQKMKEKIAASKKDLPELLTKAEQCVQKLVKDNDRSRKSTEECDVSNPPPTPETDCHDNSGDGIDQPVAVVNVLPTTRKTEQYEDDFLDLGSAADMDLF